MKNKTLWIELAIAVLYFFAALFPIETPSESFTILATILKALCLMEGVTHMLEAYHIENERRNNDG